MEYARATAHAMHDDHMTVLALLDRTEQLVQRHSEDTPPDGAQTETRMLLSDLKAAVHGEIAAHFAFEEDELFPILEDAGADDMTGILKGEHDVLLPLGRRLADLADVVGREGFTTDRWTEFRQLAGAFTTGLRSHVDKEEMGMVPALEDILDEDQDEDLIAGYKFV